MRLLDVDGMKRMWATSKVQGHEVPAALFLLAAAPFWLLSVVFTILMWPFVKLFDWWLE